MKRKLILGLSLAILSIFLINTVSAMLVYVEWDTTDSNTLQINDGESAMFNILILSSETNPITSVKLYDSSGEVYTFLNILINEVKEYTISQSIYKTSGDFYIEVIGTDSFNTDSETLFLTILPAPNTPPVLDSIGNKQVDENELLQFTISGTDADGDDLTYSASGLPSGASFNPSTKTFSWTPTYTQSGTYQVKFTVSDGKATDSKTITITVKDVDEEPNNAPEITSTPITEINEKETYTYQVTATDADEDTLTYSLTQNPLGFSINSNTGLITGTAPEVTSDTDYDIIVQVFDGEDYTTQPYILTVKNVVPGNNDPIITTTAVTQVDENQDYSYDVEASDPDGDALTYSLTENPTWLSINSNTGLITGTAPEVSFDTNYSITVKVSDGNGGSDTQTYILTVNNVKEKDDNNGTTNLHYQGDSFYEQLYLDQFKPKTIYLEEELKEKQLSWFQKFINWLKKLFGLK
ncbi:putative Ig domain-containing protein [Candidatus Pacearchaeota archaeon]|nr:putative Ig domain-containing protein [Candidatus Pacearchaeota archaeon]